jgi:hypothetical protein
MKKLFVLGLMILGMIGLKAQKAIDVVSKELEVEKIKRAGLAVNIELDEKFVKEVWKKQIKDYGKSDSKGNLIWIDVANIPAISNTPVKLYSSTISSSKGTTLWIAIDMGDKYVVEGGQGYDAAKKFLRDFAVSCYKSDLEEQVKEAQKALESSQKKEEKVLKDGENLTSDLQNNGQEKIKLEQDLKDNAAEKIQLEKDIEQNKKDQTAAKEEVAKMKKALELKQAEVSQVK